ncbi:MAG: glutamine--fructose-6-phosphate transaminase (isomerizing) [Gammaproteobacteria bacterium]|nr:glutamine--fructose-6-phosphate transaminase (isomerizing) [Gammaproteobacteria bacterium]
MCGIVGAVSTQDVTNILLNGLRALEYRGYDSAGIAVLSEPGVLQRARAQGKVSVLAEILIKNPIAGTIGIAHTRWATHGVPSESNAHPHIIGGRVALVHNGIIENAEALMEPFLASGYKPLSDTDSEVVGLCILEALKKGNNILEATQETVHKLEGAYALCVVDILDSDTIIGVRSGPPLVVGLGEYQNFLASDTLALRGVTDRFIYMEDGDIAVLTREKVTLYNAAAEIIQRPIHHKVVHQDAVDKGSYQHFMLKEIFEQPTALRETLKMCVANSSVLEKAFGPKATDLFDKVQHVQIVACGTSFYAGMVARLWLEDIAGVACQVEIASEFRYRKRVLLPNTLLVCISQSGETADTLAALRSTQNEAYVARLSICNVPDSSLVRDSELVFLTQAGAERGVCSTKGFSTQLVALFLLSLALGRRFGLDKAKEKALIEELCQIPMLMEQSLAATASVQALAQIFASKSSALFLGRGLGFPMALEGALKLKELSYIHAEAYPAGELKHGPMALVDEHMPVLVLAPPSVTLDKIKSNIQEVRSRGGELIVLTAEEAGIHAQQGVHCLTLPQTSVELFPLVYTIPLQLLAYYVALLKGTDVDQPRNLAKSVTVE